MKTRVCLKYFVNDYSERIFSLSFSSALIKEADLHVLENKQLQGNGNVFEWLQNLDFLPIFNLGFCSFYSF